MSQPHQGIAQDVILAKDGNPFKSEAAAKKMAAEMKLSPDIYAIINHGSANTWAIVRRSSATFQTEQALAQPAVEKKAERFFRVRFHARQNTNESQDVEGCVNGEILRCPRETETIMPERFLRHFALCKYPDERQLPGQPRKIVGWIQVFPFTVIGETTKAEFIRERREGTAKTLKQFTVDHSATDFSGNAPQSADAALKAMGIEAQPQPAAAG